MNGAQPYSSVLVSLLRGPLYASSTKNWDLLFRHRSAVEAYFGQLGLETVVAEHDGLAFLRRRREEDAEAGEDLPELTVKRQLPYLASLLCVLLVEELYRFEATGGGEARLVLERSKIRDLVTPFLPNKTNEAKQEETLNAQINNLVKYGFLRAVGDKGEEIEVAKLLKYRIDAAAVAEIKERLASYAGSIDV